MACAWGGRRCMAISRSVRNWLCNSLLMITHMRGRFSITARIRMIHNLSISLAIHHRIIIRSVVRVHMWNRQIMRISAWHALFYGYVYVYSYTFQKSHHYSCHA